MTIVLDEELDQDLWWRFMARATDEALPVNVVVQRLVALYADGVVSVRADEREVNE